MTDQLAAALESAWREWMALRSWDHSVPLPLTSRDVPTAFAVGYDAGRASRDAEIARLIVAGGMLRRRLRSDGNASTLLAAAEWDAAVELPE